ncbi:MAG: 50S ribosomal protein L29 [Thermodesulfobacteriota bacterium]|nr:50S ribosomal protein L29 [Thermodesulfobacteriota bacterium]
MKADKLRDLALEELRDRERDLREELFNLNFQHGTSQLENPMRIRRTRENIARVLTVIRERARADARDEGQAT